MTEASSDKHSEGLKVGKFCSERSEKCTCGNRYKSPCTSQMTQWSKTTKSLGLKRTDWKLPKLVGRDDRLQQWGGQAHHTLCVASVTGKITAQPELEPTLNVTEWCVNHKENMLALPIWPLTVRWYSTMRLENSEVVHGFKARTVAQTPPFVGLAQHDYDHNLYNRDVDSAMKEIADDAKKQGDKHEETAATIKAKLDSSRDAFKGTLQGRTTDEAWFQGLNGTETWWEEFSMVGAAGVERAFPSREDSTWSEMIQKMLDAFTKLPTQAS
ncbi:MAG: hypothetical protein ABW321_35550 [Polyangiales bacterium]